jgi:ankyrin repeat protein
MDIIALLQFSSPPDRFPVIIMCCLHRCRHRQRHRLDRHLQIPVVHVGLGIFHRVVDAVLLVGFVTFSVVLHSFSSHSHSPETHRPLHVAVKTGNIEAIDLLVKYGALLNEPDWEGETPLHVAAAKGVRFLLERLIEADADITIKSRYRETAADVASQCGQTECFQYLGV